AGGGSGFTSTFDLTRRAGAPRSELHLDYERRRAFKSREGEEPATAEDAFEFVHSLEAAGRAFDDQHASRGVSPVDGAVERYAVRLAGVDDARGLPGRDGELLQRRRPAYARRRERSRRDLAWRRALADRD